MQAHTLQIGPDTINYYQSAGTGPAALLIHGNSLSGLSFRHQIASELGAQYRIVAIDLPGHGLSSPATDPQQTYTLPGYAAIVLEVVERLELQNAVIAGWSLGGHVVLEASDRLQSAAGLMIFGAPPLGVPPAMAEAFLPNPALGAVFKAELTDAEIEAFITALFRPDAHENGQLFQADVRRTDPQARAIFAGSIGPGGYRDEIEAVTQLSCPLAVLHGADEQLVNLAYLQGLAIPTLWRGAVQIVPGAGHTPHWEQPRLFNALLEAFLAETVSAADA